MAQTRDEINAYYRVYLSQKYKTRRAEILGAFGGKCAKCSSISGPFRSERIDGSVGPINVLKDWWRKWDSLEAEIPLCRLVCVSCFPVKRPKNVSRKRLTLEERFWAKIQKTGGRVVDGWWTWKNWLWDS